MFDEFRRTEELVEHARRVYAKANDDKLSLWFSEYARKALGYAA